MLRFRFIKGLAGHPFCCMHAQSGCESVAALSFSCSKDVFGASEDTCKTLLAPRTGFSVKGKRGLRWESSTAGALEREAIVVHG